MRYTSLPTILLSTVMGCQSQTGNEDTSSNQNTPVENHAPQIMITNSDTEEHIQTSDDFGFASDTLPLHVYKYNCYEPIELEYDLFDRDGDEVRPVAYVDRFQSEFNYEPFDYETNSDLMVNSDFETDFYSDDLLQISASHFESDSIHSGTFSFSPEFPNTNRGWYIDVLFVAYDDETISQHGLQTQFHLLCGW